MDGSLKVFLPAGSPIGLLKFHTPVFEWEGKTYQQGASEAHFGQNFKIIRTEMSDYINKNLPANLKGQVWDGYSIEEDGIDLFIQSLLRLGIEENDYSLKDLLHLILNNQNKWVVVFSSEHDGFKTINKVADSNEVLAIFEKDLSIGALGFLAYSS